MNSPSYQSNVTPPPISGGTNKKGCLGCVGMLVGVPVVLLLIGYLVLFHTSLPLKWAGGMIEDGMDSDGPSIELRGVGGSISSGLKVKEIIVGGDEGGSVIEGLKIQYTGPFDSYRNRQLILEEVSTERSTFVVGSNFFKDMVEEDDEEKKETDKTPDDEPENQSGGEGEGLKLFELRKLNLKDSKFVSSDGELDVDIPLVRLSGLKIEGDEFALEDLEIVSDGISVELHDAEPATIEGQLVPFTRQVKGKILPELHPLVKSEIDFSLEMGSLEGAAASRILVFDGAWYQSVLPGGKSRVEFKDFNLGDFMDVGGLILPEHFTMRAQESDNTVTIGKGEFFLGKTNFQILQQQVDADDPKAAIRSSAAVGDYQITATVRPAKEQVWPPVAVELASKPQLKRPELLAQIYFQITYEELEPDQKSRIDDLVGSNEESR